MPHSRPGDGLFRGLTSMSCSVPHLLAPKLHPGSGLHYLKNGLLRHLGEDLDDVLTFLTQVILGRGPQGGAFDGGGYAPSLGA